MSNQIATVRGELALKVGDAEAVLAAIEEIRELVGEGWRANFGYEYDTKTEAYAAGRDWMIDKIRDVLSDLDERSEP